MAQATVTPTMLRRIPIFSGLTDEQLGRIIASPDNEVVSFKPLDAIVTENDVGDCMYVILEGAVEIRIKTVSGRDITIATLKPQDFFGEQALLPGATGRRNASVRALKTCRLFKITKSDVVLGLSHDESLRDGVADIEAATEEDRVKLLLRSVRLFRSLSQKDFARIEDWTEIVHFDAGSMIMRENAVGDFMYVVLDGTVDVFAVDDDGRVVVLAKLSRGHYFGEQALLPGGPGTRNANVRADTAVTLVRVAKMYFQLIVDHDDRLLLALQVIGEEQRKKIEQAIGGT